jgi:hypothetical protein
MLQTLGEVLAVGVLFWIAIRKAYRRGKDIGFQSGKVYGWGEGWKACLESQKQRSALSKEAGQT